MWRYFSGVAKRITEVKMCHICMNEYLWHADEMWYVITGRV